MIDATPPDIEARLAAWHDAESVEACRQIGRQVGAYYAELVAAGMPKGKATMMASQVEYRLFAARFGESYACKCIVESSPPKEAA